MGRSRLGFVALFGLAAVVAVAACGTEGDSSGGGASGTGASSTGGASSGSGGASSGRGGASSGSGGAAGCTSGEERCLDGQHQVCDGTSYQDAPCGADQGCDDASGACLDCLCTSGETALASTRPPSRSCDSCLAFDLFGLPTRPGLVGDACVDLICVPGSATAWTTPPRSATATVPPTTRNDPPAG